MRNVQPMLACLGSEPFDGGKNWLFEIKWDGERAIAEIENGKVCFYSRNNRLLTEKYPELQELASLCKAKSLTLDGEICVLDKQGRARFELLQQRIGLSDPFEIKAKMVEFPVCYFVFDILEIDGRLLVNLPLFERKKVLKKNLKQGKFVRLSNFQIGRGRLFFQAAKRLGLEGVMAKNGNSKYEMGKRSKNWLKIKITNQQEFVIGGWTEGRGSRKGAIGAVLVGYYKPRLPWKKGLRLSGKTARQALIFAGRVGTGFAFENLKELEKKLSSLEIQQCPFENFPQTKKKVHWVRPILVCEIRFAGWTKKSLLRQPVYLGLRSDKKAYEVVKES
jgi:bifunctional non-homologous end joining protein LigD